MRHPILHLAVVDREGARTDEQRVFCRLRRESIDVDHCRSCLRCDAIQAGPAPSVDCSVTPPLGVLAPDPLGERTEIGTLLQAGTVVVGSSASLNDALSVLRGGDLRSVSVVGGDHVLVGVLYDVALSERCAAPGHASDRVTTVMSSAFAIHESTPVRRALRFLASAHLRQAAIISTAGVPLGVFRDVEGLRWIARARSGATDSAWVADG